jgi:hypothetical protein
VAVPSQKYNYQSLLLFQDASESRIILLATEREEIRLYESDDNQLLKV